MSPSSYAFLNFGHYAQNELGHPFIYHYSFQQAAESIGASCTVYAPLNCSVSDLPSGWIRWFSPVFNRKGRRGFWKNCFRLFRSHHTDSSHRIFFLEMFNRRDFLPFACAALLLGKRKDSLWILYRDDLETRRKKDRATIFFFSRLLQWKFRGRCLALTDSDQLASYYQGKLKKSLVVLPIPHIDFTPRAFRSFSKQHLICSWPGHPRKDKGNELIDSLVKIQDPEAKHCELDISGATFLPPVENGLSIHLRKALLNRAEYLDSLFRADVILLPHDPILYQRRTSGIFVEAILAGKVPIVRKGTWLEHELNKFQLGDLAVDWANPLFFSDLFKRLDHPILWEKLQRMQDAYAQFHSLPSFAAQLKDLLPC